MYGSTNQAITFKILQGIDNYGILQHYCQIFMVESSAVHLNIVVLLIIKVDNLQQIFKVVRYSNYKYT